MSGFFNYPWRPSESLLFLRSPVYHVTSHYSSTITVCIPPSDQVIFFFFVGPGIRLLFLGVKSWKERKGKSLYAVVIAINCHVSWKIGLLLRFARIPEMHPGNFMISKVTAGIRNAFLLIKTNSSHRLDQTGLLGLLDFSLPLNVSPDISIRPVSVYLQTPAKLACSSYGETRNLYFP